jgi:hypothetical protein
MGATVPHLAGREHVGGQQIVRQRGVAHDATLPPPPHALALGSMCPSGEPFSSHASQS